MFMFFKALTLLYMGFFMYVRGMGGRGDGWRGGGWGYIVSLIFKISINFKFQ